MCVCVCVCVCLCVYIMSSKYDDDRYNDPATLPFSLSHLLLKMLFALDSNKIIAAFLSFL